MKSYSTPAAAPQVSIIRRNRRALRRRGLTATDLALLEVAFSEGVPTWADARRIVGVPRETAARCLARIEGHCRQAAGADCALCRLVAGSQR